MKIARNIMSSHFKYVLVHYTTVAKEIADYPNESTYAFFAVLIAIITGGGIKKTVISLSHPILFPTER